MTAVTQGTQEDDGSHYVKHSLCIPCLPSSGIVVSDICYCEFSFLRFIMTLAVDIIIDGPVVFYLKRFGYCLLGICFGESGCK